MSDEPQIEIREDPNPRRAVNISFEKSSTRKLKYLEAEPKILGTTQIVLACFYSFAIAAQYANDISRPTTAVTAVFSIPAIIAGCLGIAAQNLHLPTIKACLGMQVVACVASVIFTIIELNDVPYFMCEKESSPICQHLYETFTEQTALQQLLLAVQIALSATLAAYCCKVIECCSSSSSVPVITVNGPPDPQ